MRYEVYEIVEVTVGLPYDGVQKTAHAFQFKASFDTKREALKEIKDLKKTFPSKYFTILEVY